MRQFLFGLLFLSLSLQAVQVDLCDPSYSDGVLATDKGGIIEANGIRIQADNISYTKREGIECVRASGNLMIEYGCYTFIGAEIDYDFISCTGNIYCGRTEIPPWIVGGGCIHLCQDGNLLLYDSFATTSQAPYPEWMLTIEKGHLENLRYLNGRGVKGEILGLPVLWVPRFKMDLQSIEDFPIRYKLRVGGVQDSLFGVTYEMFSWRGWQTFLTLDYRFNRGPGGGFETYFRSPTYNICFHTLGYIADDRSDADPDPTTRYRLQGYYRQYLDNDNTKILLTYDWLSDENMATDYCDRGLRLEAAERTQLHVRRQRENWITNLYTRVRINDFQTVKQELPRMDYTIRPFTLPGTGLITEAKISTSYLDFDYSDNQNLSTDYHSPRFEINSYSYRPFHYHALHFTPGAGVVSIFYGNNQSNKERWTLLGLFEGTLTTDFNRSFGCCKHVITPYAHYQYFTTPSTNPSDLLVFDIADGWYYLNQMRFGVRQNLFCLLTDDFVFRPVEVDLYANAFYHTDTIFEVIPKMYLDTTLFFSRRMRYQLQTAWDFETRRLDHFNSLIEWTVDNDIAFSMEYRHRSPFAWRKADHTNFIIDSFRSVQELADSNMSDRRDTFLAHLFWRFHREWALEGRTRIGWNRNPAKLPPNNQPYPGETENLNNFVEYELNLHGNFHSTWHLTLSYRHREAEPSSKEIFDTLNDNRFALYFSIGLKRPCYGDSCMAPRLDF